MIAITGLVPLLTALVPQDLPVIPQVTELQPPGALIGDWWGSAVAVEGDTLAVAGQRAVSPAGGHGVVAMYRNVGGVWTFEQQLWDPAPALVQPGHIQDYFGASIGLSNGVLAVNAATPDINVATYFFYERAGSTWTEVDQLTPVASGGTYQGPLAIDDGTLLTRHGTIIYAPGTYENEVHLHVHDGSTWVHQGELNPVPGEYGFAWWGGGIDVQADTAIVGSPISTNTYPLEGSTYVFKRTGTSWALEARLVAPDPLPAEPVGSASGHLQFGAAVALDQDTLAIGAPGDHTVAGKYGAVYLFTRTGTTWSFQDKVHRPEPWYFWPTEGFGSNGLALDGDHLFVGVPNNSVGVNSWAGAVEVYERSGTSWSWKQTLVPNQLEREYYGRTVAVDAGTIVVGAPSGSFEGLTGSMYVHETVDAGVGSSFCFGDGSGVACPCGNTGTSGGGCANETGDGARLTAIGSASVGADDLAFVATRLPRHYQPALLFMGTDQLAGGAGIAFGDGLLCVGGATQRLGIRFGNEYGQAQWDAGLGVVGGWAMGDTRAFQVWYRSPNRPCPSSHNQTQGLEVTFGP